MGRTAASGPWVEVNERFCSSSGSGQRPMLLIFSDIVRTYKMSPRQDISYPLSCLRNLRSF